MGDIFTPLGQMFGLIDTPAQGTEAAANTSASESQYQFDQQQANMKPWLTQGTAAVNQLGAGMQPGGQFATTPTFQFDQSKIAMDPGYAWRTQQGNNAITAAGAAGGNLGSGNLGVALQNYGQQAGSQEYGAAYNRAYGSQMDAYNSQLMAQNTNFNRLSGIAGTGQTTAQQLGTAGMNMASNNGALGVQAAGIAGQQQQQQYQNLNGAMNQMGNQIGGGFQAANYNNNYQNYLSSIYQNPNDGALWNSAQGNINNVDFGNF